MKRFLIGTLVVAAIAAPLMAINASAAAKPAKEGKPKKIDVASVVVQGGNPYPLGLTSPDGVNFGRVELSFPAPTDAVHIDNFIVTCAPRAVQPVDPLLAVTDLPQASEVAVFSATSDSYSTATAPPGGAYSKDATGIHLFMPTYRDPATQGVGPQFPPLACQVDAQADPTLHIVAFPGGGGGTAVGKAPKVPTSPSVDCGPLDGAVGQPASPVITPPLLTSGATAGNTLHLGVQIDAGGGVAFAFCSTDASYRARYLTDQTTIFTASTKVKFKAAKLNKDGTIKTPASRQAFVKKLLLTSPLNSSIPLQVSGSVLTFTFDPAKLQVTGGSAGCTMKAPKLATAVNKCVVDNALGTITLNSSDSNLVKPGKPIVSAPTDIAFDYVGTGDPLSSSDIHFGSAATSISIGSNTVNVVLAATGIKFGLADANINAPVVTLTGLQ